MRNPVAIHVQYAKFNNQYYRLEGRDAEILQIYHAAFHRSLNAHNLTKCMNVTAKCTCITTTALTCLFKAPLGCILVPFACILPRMCISHQSDEWESQVAQIEEVCKKILREPVRQPIARDEVDVNRLTNLDIDIRSFDFFNDENPRIEREPNDQIEGAPRSESPLRG